MVDAFEDVIIPRETLIAMTASLSSRHGRFDPEVVGRMVGADPLDIPAESPIMRITYGRIVEVSQQTQGLLVSSY